MAEIYRYNRVNLPNIGCLLNIGNGPQSGPSIYNGTKGRKVAHHCVERPISGIGKHPEFGEFTLKGDQDQTPPHPGTAFRAKST